MAQTALAMVLVGMFAISFMQLYGGQFAMLSASKSGLQAQQYAELDATTLRLLSYDDLDIDGAHTRQDISSASGWQDEVTIGTETTLDTSTSSKLRIATINIYKTNDTLTRFTLKVPLSSQGSSDSPVGTIIIWPFSTLPTDGKWLECNGQAINASLYPKLAAMTSYTPNYQGVFLRGLGSQAYADGYGNVLHSSNSLGALQGDSIRNLTGSGSVNFNAGAVTNTSGVFSSYGRRSPINMNTEDGNNDGSTGINMNIANSVPTSNENRPINMAVRYLIKAK